MVVNFDAWDADLAAEPGNASASDRTILMAREGIEAFESALQRVGIPQLVACAGDFDRRRARWLSGLREIEQDGTSRLYPRPGLANPYEGPGDALEEVLTELWQQLLGVERVGVQDDFFELGGDSLLGTRLFGRIREIFGIELPLQRLFESRTCSALASTLRSHETAPGRIEAIARVRLKVERLSADEVEAALAEFRAKGRSEAAPGENPW